MKPTFIRRYILFVSFLWSVACLVALVEHLQDDYRQTVRRLQTRATTMLERDVLYRDWIAGHGGVYVPVTETSLPNPYLKFLPERDIVTADGRHFTLVNPSLMTHQAFEMDNRLGDSISKITSRKFLNPDNAPDAWEESALARLEEGQQSVSDIVATEGRSYIRTMLPFVVEESCLRCHSEQGYKLGDVRGGLSVAIAFDSSFLGHLQRNLKSIGLFSMLWVFGVLGIAVLGRKIHSQILKTMASDQQRDEAETSLDFLSNYDRMTNLPNRFKFEELLHEMLTHCKTSADQLVVTVLEIRNLGQTINNFGSASGDFVLKTVAERIAVACPTGHAIARADENRLIVAFAEQKDRTSAETMLQGIFAEASKPMIQENHEFFPLICLGAAVYPEDATDVEQLVQKAGTALTFCLQEKKSGSGFYCSVKDEKGRVRLEIERGLRLALDAGAFELYLQPQVDAASGALVGAEALLRWQHPERGYISPAEFIPVAEETDLIVSIGKWVLQAAAQQAIRLHQTFNRVIPIGVNVSARQFKAADFVDLIDEVLAIEGMAPEMLEIEITEGTFIEDIGRTIELLTDLKVRGLEIAIDDFGTGYSSLSYLNTFPVDRLKIDRSFVNDIAESEEGRLLVGLIVELGRKLGLNVIAEGVEDDTQKNLLIGMGCHAIQGFLFSRPLPFDDFCSWLESQGET